MKKFTPDSFESKFLAKTNADEMKYVDSMFPQPASYIKQNSIGKTAGSNF